MATFSAPMCIQSICNHVDPNAFMRSKFINFLHFICIWKSSGCSCFLAATLHAFVLGADGEQHLFGLSGLRREGGGDAAN